MAGEKFGLTALRQIAVALPVYVLHRLLGSLLEPLLDNRLLLLVSSLPLAIGCWVLWKVLARDRSVLLGGRFLTFFLVYVLLFGLLTSTPLRELGSTGRGLGAGPAELGWAERLLPGGRDSWLGRLAPAVLTGWRYGLAGGWPRADVEPAAASDLLVITLPVAGKERARLRWELAFLVSQARRQGARGIALDFFFEPATPADALLCHEFGRAAEAGLPLVVGYRFPRPPATEAGGALDDCIQAEQRGHLGAIVGLFGQVNGLPLFLDEERRQPASSWRIAAALGSALQPGGPLPQPPADGILRYLAPRQEIPVHEGLPRGEELTRMRDRFVVVGSSATADRHRTPYGEVQGAMLQAWAVESLRRGRFIRPLHPGWSFPAVFALCYLLTAVLARRGGWRKLVWLAAALSAVWLGLAALAARLEGLWLEVGPPLAAIWVLVGLLLAAGGVLRGRLRREAEPPAAAGAAERPFDVFLSHNGDDKPTVLELAAALEERGLRPWLDAPELIPGRPWQEALEEVIVTSRTAAVLVGPNGLGPWQQMEMRACLSQFVEHRKPVIPVLLPGAPARPNLPIFLTQFTWVDLRAGLSEAGLDRLEWGITGRKRERRRAA